MERICVIAFIVVCVKWFFRNCVSLNSYVQCCSQHRSVLYSTHERDQCAICICISRLCIIQRNAIRGNAPPVIFGCGYGFIVCRFESFDESENCRYIFLLVRITVVHQSSVDFNWLRDTGLKEDQNGPALHRNICCTRHSAREKI